MAFVKSRSVQVGDWGVTTKTIVALSGYFEPNTKVKVIDISERGYDLEDEFGNQLIETGFNSFKPL